MEGAFEVPAPIPEVIAYQPHSGPHGERVPTGSSRVVGTYPDPGAFPIAPREWRSPGPKSKDEQRIKRVILGGLALFALLAILALALGGNEPAPPQQPLPTIEAPPAVIDMTPQPAPKK